MNKKYEEPVVEIIALDSNDIVCASNCGGGNQIPDEDVFEQ